MLAIYIPSFFDRIMLFFESPIWVIYWHGLICISYAVTSTDDNNNLFSLNFELFSLRGPHIWSECRFGINAAGYKLRIKFAGEWQGLNRFLLLLNIRHVRHLVLCDNQSKSIFIQVVMQFIIGYFLFLYEVSGDAGYVVVVAIAVTQIYSNAIPFFHHFLLILPEISWFCRIDIINGFWTANGSLPLHYYTSIGVLHILSSRVLSSSNNFHGFFWFRILCFFFVFSLLGQLKSSSLLRHC